MGGPPVAGPAPYNNEFLVRKVGSKGALANLDHVLNGSRLEVGYSFVTLQTLGRVAFLDSEGFVIRSSGTAEGSSVPFFAGLLGIEPDFSKQHQTKALAKGSVWRLQHPVPS